MPTERLDIDGEQYDITFIDKEDLLSKVNRIRGTSKAEPSVETAPSGQSYIESQARQGLTQTPAMAVSAMQQFAKYAQENPMMVKHTPVGLMASLMGGLMPKQEKDFMENVAANQKIGAELTGADLSVQPKNEKERYLGAMANVATDLSSYMGGKGIPAMIKNLVASQGGAVGGEAGGQAAKEMGVDETTGRIIGGLVGGSGTSLAEDLVTKGLTGIAIKKTWGALKSIGSQDKVMKQLVETMGPDEVLKTLEQFKQGGRDVGKDFPLFIQLSNHPVTEKQMAHLVSANPSFNKQIKDELVKMKQAVDQNIDVKFGQRNPQLPTTKSDLMKSLYQEEIDISKQLDDVNFNIEKLSDPLRTKAAMGEEGKSIAQLVEKRRKAVQGEMSPKYDQLMKDATEAEVEISSDAVKNIYKFVKSNKIRDLFGKQTSIDKKVLQKLRPKEYTEEVSPILLPGQQQAPTKVVQAYPTLSFEQVDSLKREINRLKRMPLTADEKRKLKQFDDVVTQARDTMPGDFNQQLKDLDTEYFSKVGVPYSKQGIIDIDSKKYAEQVAPVIFKNKSALSHFLNVGGDEGVKIAENAFFSKMYHKVTKDGMFEPKLFNRFLNDRNNQEIIETLPNVANRVDEIKDNTQSLLNVKNELDLKFRDTQRQNATHFLNKHASDLGMNYNTLTRGLLNNFAEYDNFKKQLSQLPGETQSTVRQGLRAEVMSMAQDHPHGAYDFLTNVKGDRAKIISDVMGPSYINDAKKAGDLLDAIKDADIGRIALSREKSGSAKVAGLETTDVTATVRRPIVSEFQKVVILGSKAWDATRTQRFDNNMKELFSDPESVKKLAEFTRKYKIAKDDEVPERILYKALIVFSEAMGRATMAAERSVASEREEQQ